ncbi:hypothetical protein GCM10010219_20020 [Streptomyces netropsis]|nr:hypothetical protein GCM10010219_20020 [Streptomyces netropsis]
MTKVLRGARRGGAVPVASWGRAPVRVTHVINHKYFRAPWCWELTCRVAASLWTVGAEAVEWARKG